MRLVTKDSSVNVHGLEPQMQCVLKESYRIWGDAGINWVITSARDGIHGPASYHYFGLAVDLRTWDSEGQQLSMEKKEVLASLLRRALSQYSQFFDVLVESSHIHVEYDWTRAQRAS